MKHTWSRHLLVSLTAFGGACGITGTGPYGNDELCRSGDFREAFLEGQQGILVDYTRPSTRLVAYGDSALPCLKKIAERGGLVFAIEGCLQETHDCRTWALGAIRMIGTAEARAYLVKYLNKTTDKGLRIATIAALGALREKSARPKLLDLVADIDSDVRAESIVSLGAIGEQGDYQVMREAAVLLPDEAFYRSLQGFLVLGNKRAFEDLKPRIQTIADSTIRVAVVKTIESWRSSVAGEAQTLSSLRSKTGKDLYKVIQDCQGQSDELRAALFEILKSDDSRARAESVAALGKMNVADDFELLLKATMELPEEYVILGAQGLEFLNDARAVAPLEQYATGMKDSFRRKQVEGVIERLRRNAIRTETGTP